MKKILVYGGAFDAGGVESVMMNIIRNLSSEYSFTIIALRDYEGKYDEELRGLNHKIHKVAPISSQGIVSFYRQLKAIMQQEYFDIIHINGTQSSEIVLRAAKAAGIKKRIFHAHNTKDSFLNRMPKFTQGLLQRLLSHSIRCHATDLIACGDEAGRFVFGEKSVNYIVVNNSVDLEKFCFEKKEVATRLKSNLIKTKNETTILLGSAGRFTEIKNQIFAIKLVEKLNKEGNMFSLCLAGEGSKLEECKRYVEANNLGKCVIFLGNVSEMQNFYKAIDIFLLPSLYEGLPVTCIEAQACGVPVALSDTITKEADMGMGLMNYLPLDDIDTWVSAIKKIQCKKIYAENQCSRNVLENRFSIEHLIEVMVSVYES